MKSQNDGEVSRREFLEGAGTAIAVAALAPSLAQAQQAEPHPGEATSADASSESDVPRTTIQLTVNGELHRIEVEDRWTLVEVLRDKLGLTGTKLGCDRGECGACTVLLDSKAVYACSNLAVWADGRTIETVESLATVGRLDPLQQAFIDNDAPQCGFCTPGQLMAAKALVASNPQPTRAQVKAAMCGNLCRCGNYESYVESVMAVAGREGRV